VKILFETKTSGAPAAEKIHSPRAATTEEARPRKAPPKLREAVFDDYSQIAALQVRNGLTIRSYPDWVALWKGNPVYETSRGQLPIGWVLEAADREIVGLIGSVPFACHYQGRTVRSVAACAWVVDPRYRSHSMQLLDRLMSQKDIDLTVSTTVSSNSEPALKLFGWAKAPLGSWDRSAFWVTNHRGFVSSALKLKSVPMPRAMSYPVSAALYCRDLFRDGGALRRLGDADLEMCAGFDERFDEFWEELKRQNDGILLASRSRETLAWHFRYSMLRQRLWILAASRGSRLVAYAIFDRQDNEACGLKRIRLVDFQALKGHENNLYPALALMLRKCRREGIHILENVGCWLDRPGLPRILPPYHRTLPSALYYYHAADADLAATLADPSLWAPTTFDGDASL
jgi:hypothetical protein